MPTSVADSYRLDGISVLGRLHPFVAAQDARHLRAEPDGVSLVIPAWNEENRLPSTLNQYVAFLEGTGNRFEVIVVADGVTDRTAEIAAGYSQRGVCVLRFDRKLGKGGAVLEGLRRARFDYAGFVDADAPVTSASLADLLSELTTADAAIASRWMGKGVQHQRETFARRVLSRAWNLLTRSILGLKIRDTQCGAKFFRRDALLSVLGQVRLTNWAFDASLLFHFHRAGFRVKEVPVSWSDDPASKMRLERAIPAMFLSILGIRLMSLPRLSEIAQSWATRIYAWVD